MTAEPLLDVRNLKVEFPTRHGRLEAVSDVSLRVEPGETIAVVGESGSGKSVTAQAVLRLLPRTCRTGGSVRFNDRDLAGLTESQMRRVRGAEIAMVFQDPMTSLDPLFTIGNQLVEALRLHLPLSRRQARQRALELLREVGLPEPERRLRAHPHELSGGQRQRVMIAIAIACNPALLIADEPTTALDVTVEAQILRLIRRLQADHGTALLLITHDMGVAAEMADRIVVMYAGKVVEQGTVEEVLLDPRNPYTRALLESIPRPGLDRHSLMPVIRGTVPGLAEMPPGCRFHNRCPSALDRCRTEEPTLLELADGRQSRCWLHDPNTRRPDLTTSRGAGHVQ
ncbi:ABC transporter ATP-binding protein [Solwaraspora sp. WMMB335]|uniref:ABC transporter ATP-binding protein n=1 Tax=Solwaraspora sp. WMMB335 TaxID=3404118 RepID=UPI003B93F8C8